MGFSVITLYCVELRSCIRNRHLISPSLAGDVVLNGTRRLALTTSCLNELNYLFRQLLDGQENESFDVPAGYGGNSDFMHDVLFLHDFMQKTGSLKVHPDTGEVQPAHTSVSVFWIYACCYVVESSS